MHSKLPTSEAPPPETVNAKGDEDCAELVENTSLHFQPLISLTRDYLARLLFWLDLPFSLPLLLARVSQDINRSSQKKLCCELVLLSKTSYNYSVCVFFRWRCMLLGHYLRGLEYRMELMEVLNLTCDANGSENVAWSYLYVSQYRLKCFVSLAFAYILEPTKCASGGEDWPALEL